MRLRSIVLVAVVLYYATRTPSRRYPPHHEPFPLKADPQFVKDFGESHIRWEAEARHVDEALLHLLRARLVSEDPDGIDPMIRPLIKWACRYDRGISEETLDYRSIDDFFPPELVEEAEGAGCDTLVVDGRLTLGQVARERLQQPIEP